MSFKDEMKKIQTVKAPSPLEIKQQKVLKAYKVIDEFLEKEFVNFENYILDLVKKDIESNLRNGKFKAVSNKNGETKIVRGKIYFCSDKSVDTDRNGKEILRASATDFQLMTAEVLRDSFTRKLGFNCIYKGLGLDIGYYNIKKSIGIVFVKDGIYEKKLREFFKKIKKEEEIDISFSSHQKTTLVDNERYYIMNVNYKFVV